MKYYLIAGEASGDLHASNLMRALLQQDPQADFRFFGGDLMKSNMRLCKQDICQWSPDVVILIDYPGFNLDIAKYIHAKTSIPVYYYISPKIWAWKEYRIKNIKRDIDQLYSILPFEIDFFNSHDYPIHYVGNPSVDSVTHFISNHPANREEFNRQHELDERPIIALLAGSRKQEIKDNLPIMLEALSNFPQHQIILAGAPGIPPEYYAQYIGEHPVKILFGETYRILQHAQAALVTSGTATLETALFRVPQVVCYYTPIGKVISFLRRHILKVRFISLVNLIANREVVRELVAHTMTADNICHELKPLLNNHSEERQNMLEEYERMIRILGPAGASEKAAKEIVNSLKAPVTA